MEPLTLPRPTDAELSILRVLWSRGPSTVREVQEELERQRPTGYTTVLKLLQIMHEKGLVERDEKQRTHIYKTTQSRTLTQGRLLDDLMERAFSGSAKALVLRALSDKKVSKEELSEIRKLLETMEGDG